VNKFELARAGLGASLTQHVHGSQRTVVRYIYKAQTLHAATTQCIGNKRPDARSFVVCKQKLPDHQNGMRGL
jgi:hypothetical protein